MSLCPRILPDYKIQYTGMGSIWNTIFEIVLKRLLAFCNFYCIKYKEIYVYFIVFKYWKMFTLIQMFISTFWVLFAATWVRCQEHDSYVKNIVPTKNMTPTSRTRQWCYSPKSHGSSYSCSERPSSGLRCLETYHFLGCLGHENQVFVIKKKTSESICAF